MGIWFVAIILAGAAIAFSSVIGKRRKLQKLNELKSVESELIAEEHKKTEDAIQRRLNEVQKGVDEDRHRLKLAELRTDEAWQRLLDRSQENS